MNITGKMIQKRSTHPLYEFITHRELSARDRVFTWSVQITNAHYK